MSDNREVKTIQINGKTFVSGLFWQPFSQNVKLLGTELNMQYMVIRHTSLPQAGFVSKNALNVKAGDYSLAAVVTKALELEQIGSNWIAVIPIPDSKEYYYIVMTDDIVRPTGEFIGSFDEVKEQFIEDSNLADWNLVIAPKEFELPNSEERDLLSFFPQHGDKIKFHNWWRLTNVQNVSNHQIKVIASVLMFIMLAGGGGFYYYQKVKKDKEIERYRLQQLALKAQQSSITMIKPWGSIPSAINVMNNCIQTMNKYHVLFSAADIRMNKVTCTPTNIVFKGTKNIDTDIQLEGPNLVLLNNGTAFEYTETLGTTSSQKEEDSLDKNNVIQYLTKVSATYQFKNMSIVNSSSAPVVGQTAVTSNAIQKVDLNFDYVNKFGQNELPYDFLHIPTLRIKKAEYNINDSEYYWHIEGEIYVK